MIDSLSAPFRFESSVHQSYVKAQVLEISHRLASLWINYELRGMMLSSLG
jgi:hypothetical protein